MPRKTLKGETARADLNLARAERAEAAFRTEQDLRRRGDNSLLGMARLTPDGRRKRFLVALHHLVPRLTADDMDDIEKVLRPIAGRHAIADWEAGFAPPSR